MSNALQAEQDITTKTVGQLVVERPNRARVFEKHGIDYCCGGKIPLTQACQKKGISLDAIVAELSETDASTPDIDLVHAGLTELADHIEATHHASLRRELPRLETLARKVAAVHGDEHPELVALRDEFLHFKQDMESHALKEEQILFPAIRDLDRGSVNPGRPFGTVKHPIRVMLAEHDDAGASLARMRELTGNFTPPPTACNSYRALFAGLEDLEQDTHRHVHKENEALFPRAIEKEAQR